MKRVALLRRLPGAPGGRQRGFALIESVVALALLGIISVSFLSGLATTSKARALADEQATARILAESKLEYIKRLPYAFSYNGTGGIPEEYAGYDVTLDVDNLRNSHIQKLTVTVSHYGKDVTVLEGFKVNR